MVDRDWRLVSPAEGRRCRQPACNRPAVAALRRRHGGHAWREWAYCEGHLYGRRINGDQVEELVHPDSIAAARGWVGGYRPT